MIDEQAPDMLMRGDSPTLRRWIEALPDELVHSSPSLAVRHARSLAYAGRLDAAEARLRDAESSAAAGHVANEVELVRTIIERTRGDTGRSIERAQLLLERLAANEHALRGAVLVNMAIAFSERGAAGEAALALDGAQRRRDRTGEFGDHGIAR